MDNISGSKVSIGREEGEVKMEGSSHRKSVWKEFYIQFLGILMPFLKE